MISLPLKLQTRETIIVPRNRREGTKLEENSEFLWQYCLHLKEIVFSSVPQIFGGNANNIIHSYDHLFACSQQCKQRCFSQDEEREKLFGKTRDSKEWSKGLQE